MATKHLGSFNASVAALGGYSQGVSRIDDGGYIYTLNTDAALQAARGNTDTVDQTVLPSSGDGSKSADWVSEEVVATREIMSLPEVGARYQYFLEPDDSVSAIILNDIDSGRLITGDHFSTASYYPPSEYGDSRSHGGNNHVLVSGSATASSGDVVSPVGSLQIITLFDGIYKVTQLGAKDGVADSTPLLNNILSNISPGKETIFDDFLYNAYGLQALTGSTLSCHNGGSIKCLDNIGVNPAVAYYLIHNLGHSNVTYKSMVVDGNRANNTQFLVFDSITAGGDNSQVVDCKVVDPADSAYMVSGGSNLYVANNEARDCFDAGIYINLSFGSVDKFSAVVENNYVENCAGGGIMAKRMSHSLSIVSNQVEGSCSTGIGIDGSQNVSDLDFPGSSVIAANIINIKDFGQGIAVNNSNDVCITGGSIRLDNTIPSSKSSGIRIAGCDSGTVTGVAIKGDRATSPTSQLEGIVVMDRDGAPTTNYSITGNSIDQVRIARRVFKSSTTAPDCTNVAFSGNTSQNIEIDLRVDANMASTAVISSKGNTSTAASVIFPGAMVAQDDVDSSQSSEIRRAGYIYSPSILDPNGAIHSSCVGRKYHTAAGGGAIWESNGIGLNSWLKITP